MVGLSWTWRGPEARSEGFGNEWFELRIAELPAFFVAAPTKEEARGEAAAALEAFLASYEASGETAPRPEKNRRLQARQLLIQVLDGSGAAVRAPTIQFQLAATATP